MKLIAGGSMGFFVLLFVLAGQSWGAELPEAPSECKEKIKQAERLGKALYEKDMLAAWATDAMFHEKILPHDRRIRGWVTLPVAGGWEVRFIGRDGGTDLLLYTVKFQKFSPKSADVIRHEKPNMPSGDTAVMFRARKLASRSKNFKPLANRYNSIVLPAKMIDAKGWLVYLLAASTQADEIVLGGHYRMLVSPSGRKLLKVEPLSKRFMKLQKPKDTKDKKAVGPFVTHIISDCPIEIHVFLSLLHRTPLFVGTESGAWQVDGGKFRYLGPTGKKK